MFIKNMALSQNDIEAFKVKSGIVVINEIISKFFMSTIYYGYNPKNDKKYYIKIIQFGNNEKLKQQGYNDIIVTNHLKFKGILKLLGYFTINSAYWIAFEFLYSFLTVENFQAKIPDYLNCNNSLESKNFPNSKPGCLLTLIIFYPIVRSLIYFKHFKIVHLDLKLSNMLITLDKSTKIFNFYNSFLVGRLYSKNSYIKSFQESIQGLMDPFKLKNVVDDHESIYYKIDVFLLALSMLKFLNGDLQTEIFQKELCTTQIKQKILEWFPKNTLCSNVYNDLAKLLSLMVNLNVEERINIKNISTSNYFKLYDTFRIMNEKFDITNECNPNYKSTKELIKLEYVRLDKVFNHKNTSFNINAKSCGKGMMQSRIKNKRSSFENEYNYQVLY